MAEETVYKPKLRVTTLTEEGAVLSDRLVETQAEFYNGPKFQHKGPVRLEVTLTNNLDVENFKKYIDQLVGNLPIKTPTAGRGRPSTNGAPQLTESPREDILLAVENMAKEEKNQTDIIKYLRDLGFVFILTEDLLYYFNDFPFDPKDIGKPTENKQYLDSMSWMVRCIKRGKDPKTDKFDPMILFGFNILRPASNKVVPYLYKERKKPIRVKSGKKALSFNMVEFTKFPKYMQEDERLKFSFEQRQLLLNDTKKPSKFFLRWVRDVIFPDSIKPKIEEAIARGNTSNAE